MDIVNSTSRKFADFVHKTVDKRSDFNSDGIIGVCEDYLAIESEHNNVVYISDLSEEHKVYECKEN